MWQTIKRLKEERGQIVSQMKNLLDSAKAARRDLTADETRSFDQLETQAEAKATEINRAERERSLQQAIGNNNGPKGGGGSYETRGGGMLDGILPDLSGYSLLRAMRCKLEGRPIDGLEGEVSQELARRSGRAIRGDFMAPLSMPMFEQRDLNLTTGLYAKPTDTLAAQFIDILRNRLVVQAAGARVLTGLHGDLSIPKQTATTSAYWVAEGDPVTESNQTINQVAMAPKTVGAFTDISRKFILQSALPAELFVRQDLATVLAIEIDRAALNGSGSGAEPTGILNNSSIATVALGTNGAEPSFNDFVNLETAVASSNADVGKLAYVTTPKVRGICRNTPVFTYGNEGVWARDNTVNGYRAFVTNQMPSNLTKGNSGAVCSSLIFGNWDDLILGFWSGVDILVDPYTASTTGTVRVVALQDVDIKVRNNESFAKTKDIITTQAS